jgi:hypothetical protein
MALENALRKSGAAQGGIEDPEDSEKLAGVA